MESKKNNYKKPAMHVVEIQYQGHLLEGSEPQQDVANAREQSSNWGSAD